MPGAAPLDGAPNAEPAMISRTISEPSAEHLEVGRVGEVLEVDQRRCRRVADASRSVPRLFG